MNRQRAIIITGRHGTGKSTLAKSMLPEALVVNGNEMDIGDVHSIPNGIIIEDIHFKPKTKEIVDVILQYRGEVILTSFNEKSIPKEIKNICKIKRAGTKSYLRDEILEVAPRSENPHSYETDVFSLIMDYLKDSDRERIMEKLKFNKPSDTQIISWLSENLHPNKLLFVDGVVKRRWSQNYFYEMLAYAHSGKQFGRPKFPKRGQYSKLPNICRRLGLRSSEERLLRQLLEDDEFKQYVKTKLNNSDCRLLGFEKKEVRERKPKMKQYSLGDF